MNNDALMSDDLDPASVEDGTSNGQPIRVPSVAHQIIFNLVIMYMTK